MDKEDKMGKKKGVEEMEEKCKKDWGKGVEQGIQLEEHDKQQKWLAEGHGTGLCLSVAAHVCAFLHGAVLLEEAETQTDNVITNSTSTQTTTRTDKMASQTNAAPE
jgi:hypothetical protein